MKSPMIIGGQEIYRHTFPVETPFYPDYLSEVASAGTMEVAAAIGNARRAVPGSFSERQKWLELAANRFSYTKEDLEHAVRMTGVPITHMVRLFSEIPGWLHNAPQWFSRRFFTTVSFPEEALPDENQKFLVASPGFCYAVSPGNDPRASALVAANLAVLGIPFILRASARDALAPLVIRALIAGGFDPNFCSLIYFQGGARSYDLETQRKNFHLVDTASSLWTFGPDQSVDTALRYERRGQYAAIHLPSPLPDPLEEPQLCALLSEHGFQVQDDQIDHFTGKTVLRHNSGNSAAILQGEPDEDFLNLLKEALAFPLGCTATKSLMLVEAGEPALQVLEAFMMELVMGDPLDPETEVGYIQPATLDFLQTTLRRCRMRITCRGGQRLGDYQAEPLLVASQEALPEFFAQEIPAYLLAVRRCTTVSEAVETINHYTVREPRLAVSLHHLKEETIQETLISLNAHTILINRPTSQVLPYFHEGNDYALRLLRPRLVIR